MAVNRLEAGVPRTGYVPTATGLKAGAPYCVGQIPCVLLTDAEAASPYNATVQFDGCFDLSVEAEAAAIVIGDILYYEAADTPKINNTSSGGNVRFGYAREAIANTLTDTIKVQIGY